MTDLLWILGGVIVICFGIIALVVFYAIADSLPTRKELDDGALMLYQEANRKKRSDRHSWEPTPPPQAYTELEESMVKMVSEAYGIPEKYLKGRDS